MTATARVESRPDAVSELLADNCHFLDQLAEFIAGCGPETYARCDGPFGGNGIGRQVRHVLDHVQALLAAASGEVDYERRERDTRVETCPGVALETLATLRRRLAGEGLTRRGDTPVWVACREGGLGGARSSWQRELMFLASHTVHHMALIALLAQRDGLPTDPRFGVAPSTLRHWRQQAADSGSPPASR